VYVVTIRDTQYMYPPPHMTHLTHRSAGPGRWGVCGDDRDTQYMYPPPHMTHLTHRSAGAGRWGVCGDDSSSDGTVSQT